MAISPPNSGGGATGGGEAEGNSTNTQNPPTKELNGSRIKMGIIGVLSSGDEAAFSSFHTVIVRALGGGDVALGLIGSVVQSVGQLFSWIGAVILRLCHFNRKGLVWALSFGAIIQAAIIVLLVMAAKTSTTAEYWLYGYIGLITTMVMLTGASRRLAQAGLVIWCQSSDAGGSSAAWRSPRISASFCFSFCLPRSRHLPTDFWATRRSWDWCA